MKKLIAPLLITLMALSVLSCAGIVSAQTPKATVQPQVIGPPTPQYYTVDPTHGKTYVFGPGHYNWWGTSLDRNLPGVVQATASPNTGNLYVYASSKSAYTYYEYAEALNGVNLYVSAPTGTPATTVTVTVMVRLISASVSGSGHVEVGALVGTQNMGYMDFTGPRIAPQTLPPFMNTIPINPAPGFSGWNTGTTHQVGGYLTAYLSGSGTVIARAQVQYIELQFS